MTSGVFETVMIGQITVDRENRQRKAIENEKLVELAESIRSLGLINPPVVTRNFELIAGERRLLACKHLGWSSIPVQFSDTLDPDDLHMIELEENTKRLDLTWKEEMQAIVDYHNLRLKRDPEWSAAATGTALHYSDNWVRRNLLVARAIEENVEGVEDAQQFSTALNVAQRNLERKKASALQEVQIAPVFRAQESAPAEPGKPATIPALVLPPKRIELINASFLDWVKAPPRRFNFIHCDFPYGVNVGDKSGQSAAKNTGSYEDSPDIYFELLDAFISNTDKFVEPSAHLVFWFSMKFFAQTKSALSAGGWDIQDFPLIWHKTDNAGILPDKDRQPRRIYETALIGTRGDRKLVRPVANCIGAATTRELHTSEKPKAVLEHFFRMFVDEHTSTLDPTAGSANAIAVSDQRGAAYSLGIEKDPEFFKGAKQALRL